MNADLNKQSIHIKDGFMSSRPRRINTISIINPLDDSVDIGKKAWRMRDVLLMFKNRYKIIKEKHFLSE